MKKRSKIGRTPFTPLTVLMLIALILYTLTLVGLLYWGVITSLKDDLFDFRVNAYKLPKKIVNNFSLVWEEFTAPVRDKSGAIDYVGMDSMYLYSMLYSLGCAFTNTLVPCITSYFCAKFKYKWSKVMHTTVIVVMIIPVVGSLPSEIQIANALGLYGHIWGLWIMKANFLGLYFLVFYEFFASLPDSYIEVAKIDGAGNLAVLTRIALPLAKNIFLTVMLVNFIGFWNDYQTPLVYIKDRYPTVAYGMFTLAMTSEGKLSSVPVQVTGTVMMFVPILILFIALNKRLLGNLSIGGIKG